MLRHSSGIMTVNLLLYAVNEDTPFHRKAKAWLNPLAWRASP